MQAYDVKRKRIVNVMRVTDKGAIAAYTVPSDPKGADKWYYPQIEHGKNVEPFEILEHEQISMFSEVK